MFELLRDPLWQFVGVFLSVLSIIISIIIFIYQRKYKQLSYEIIASFPLVTISEKYLGHIEFKYNNDKVKINDAFIVILKITNTGNTSIKSADYERPITISFGTGTEILSSEIIGTPQIKEYASIKNNATSITVSETLLNKDDSIILRAMIDKFNGIININARIVDVGKFKVFRDPSIEIKVNLFIGVFASLLIDLFGKQSLCTPFWDVSADQAITALIYTTPLIPIFRSLFLLINIKSKNKKIFAINSIS